MPKAGRTISNMRYLKTKQLITHTQLKEKTEVESLDECCFAMTKKYRKNYSFIFTPCYIISTSPVKALAKLTKSAIKNLTKQAN